MANNGNSQNIKVTINEKNIQLERLLNEIEKQTDYLFIYSKVNVDVSRKVSVNVTDKSVQEVLDQILDNSPVQYMVEGTHIILSRKEADNRLPAPQQSNIFIGGTVVDEKGDALIGANVIEKGVVGNGAITDIDGHFSLTVSPGAILEVSYIGYLPREITIVSGTANYRIVMTEDSKSLEEVVVVGYGVQKKKLVTGATVQVSGDEVLRQNRTEILGALQGQTPGVNITQSSGMPGESFKVTIRGLGTIGNAAPLYVIDGIPGGDINNLNPSDIESIDVLKDAASAAIYGARAANGVILVTTRQGRSGKIQFNYDGYYGFQNVAKMVEPLNARQYMDIINEALINSNSEPYNFATIIPVQYQQIQNGTWNGTNWLNEIRNKNAPVQNHAVNLLGGTDFSKFTMGFTYSRQEAILGKPVALKNERYTIRLNSNHVLLKIKGFDAITIGENMTYGYRENIGIAVGGLYGNDFRGMIAANPLLPAYDSEGNYYDMADKEADQWNLNAATGNPLASMVYGGGNNLNKNYFLGGNIYIEVQPVNNLKYRTVFGYRMGASSFRSYTPAIRLSASSELQDRTTQRASSNHRWSWENTFNYAHNINENHNIDYLLGMSMEKWGMGENLSARNGNSLFPGMFDYAYIDNSPGIVSGVTEVGGNPASQGRLQSVFGRVNYNYMEKYMLTLIMRGDGSSTFAPGHRWGYFPSVSAGWVVTNESFMDAASGWIDFLKLRGSWGQNGNCDVAAFQYLSTIAFGNRHSYFFGTDKQTITTGGYPDVLPNPDITWETSEQLDLGFDMRFLNSRLGVVFDWYNKITKNWLVQAPILDSFGTGAPYINGGDIKNIGVEFGLTWNERVNNDFKYSLNFNISKNKNQVTRIDNSEGIIHGDANVLFESSTEIYRAEVGYPIGYFWGYKTAGIFQNQEQIDNTPVKLPNTVPGDVIFVNTNGDDAITDEDKIMIGDPNPDATIGFNANFEYKGFDMGITMMGAFGHQNIRAYRGWASSALGNYTVTDMNERWHGEGTSNKYPRITYGAHPNRQYISDLYIEDADFMRIQNLTIGYDFKKIFPAIPFGQARLYITAQNLYTFTSYKGMDPEVGFGQQNWASGMDIGFYPSPRTILAGINLKF
jgi:TonB-linked SusC/RagA family outer membrane protein